MIGQVLIKELRLLFRDIHGIAVLFIMPIIFILIMSLALSDADNVNKNLKVAFVSTGNTLSISLADKLKQEQELSITHFKIEEIATVQADLNEGLYDLIIVNPNIKYGADLKKDRPLELQVLASTDNTWLLKGHIQQYYTQLRIDQYFEDLPKVALPEINKKAPKAAQAEQRKARAAAQKAQPDLKGLETFLSAPLLKEIYITSQGSEVKQPNSVQQSVPAWLIFGMFFIMIPLSNVMADEKITNTITRLRLAKASPLMLLFSKLLPYFLVNQIQFIGMMALGVYGLPLMGIAGLELNGPLVNYLFLSVTISLAALGYGLLISVIAKSTEHAVVLGGGGNIIMAAIGGIMVPSYIMPESMQMIAKLSPMSWGLRGFHDLLLNQYSFIQILPIGGVLAGFGALFLLFAYFFYWRQLKGYL